MTAPDWRPDPALHGNGDPCPACELRRDDLRKARAIEQAVPCNFCGGTGRVGRAVVEIIREAVEWARREYWPERERAWAEQNGREAKPEGRQT